MLRAVAAGWVVMLVAVACGGGGDGSDDDGTSPIAFDKTCTSASDCALARQVGACCEGCFTALNADWIAGAPCWRTPENMDPVPKSCMAKDCPEACPTAMCQDFVGVECQGGICVAQTDAGQQ